MKIGERIDETQLNALVKWMREKGATRVRFEDLEIELGPAPLDGQALADLVPSKPNEADEESALYAHADEWVPAKAMREAEEARLAAIQREIEAEEREEAARATTTVVVNEDDDV